MIQKISKTWRKLKAELGIGMTILLLHYVQLQICKDTSLLGVWEDFVKGTGRVVEYMSIVPCNPHATTHHNSETASALGNGPFQRAQLRTQHKQHWIGSTLDPDFLLDPHFLSFIHKDIIHLVVLEASLCTDGQREAGSEVRLERSRLEDTEREEKGRGWRGREAERQCGGEGRGECFC